MQIGSVIRKYRKECGLTQEEMAKRLGVTTPAVNKWENGNTNPDIELLAPIARLLHISLDTLLSFQEKLTDMEIETLIRQMGDKLEKEGFEKTYEWAVQITKKYPNCNMLIWQIAVMLDAGRITGACGNPEQYDEQINAWYEMVLQDENEEIQYHAADSLFGFYLREKEYVAAEKYLNYFSEHDPMKKIFRARLYKEQGKTEEAYKTIEEVKDAVGIKFKQTFWGYSFRSYVTLNGRQYEASPTQKSYYFDSCILSEIRKLTPKDTEIELVANVNLCFDNIDFKKSDPELTNIILIHGLPIYLERYGPYNQCVDEMRESPYLVDYRRWLLDNHEHLQKMEIAEITSTVEAEIEKISKNVLLKYLKENSYSSLKKTVAKTIISSAAGALPIIGFSVSPTISSCDVVSSISKSIKAKQMRWSGFIIEARQKLQEEMHENI